MSEIGVTIPIQGIPKPSYNRNLKEKEPCLLPVLLSLKSSSYLGLLHEMSFTAETGAGAP